MTRSKIIEQNININHYIKEQIIIKIAQIYLWEIIELDSKEFEYLFNNTKYEYLERIIAFFFNVRKEKLSDKIKISIIAFWQKCSEKLPDNKHKLYNKIILLSCYLDNIDDNNKDIICKIIPRMLFKINSGDLVGFSEFFEILNKWGAKKDNIENIILVLEELKNAGYKNYFDYESRVKSLIKTIYTYNKEKAKYFANSLLSTNDGVNLIKELKM